MSDEPRAFVDSNILIYAVSKSEPEKQRRAKEIVARGFAENCYAISTQVMLEVYVNVTRKALIGWRPAQAFEYIQAFTEWTVLATTPELVMAALRLADRFGISVWDAAILEAAHQAGCRQVLSEDLGDGQVYRGVTVRNPFADLSQRGAGV